MILLQLQLQLQLQLLLLLLVAVLLLRAMMLRLSRRLGMGGNDAHRKSKYTFTTCVYRHARVCNKVHIKP